MKVIGISGSPTKDSNTDTLVKAILEATGAQTEFFKLSSIKVGPCTACMKCVQTNECIINDDFKWLSKKVMEADAIVVGSSTFYGAASAFTKAFIERLDYKFIKLSEYHIHPCRACLGCSKDNICKQPDDWHIVENKIKECSIKEKSELQSQSWSGGEYQA